MVVLLVLVLVTLALAIYLTFYYQSSCTSYDCFQSAMKKCTHAVYVNEASEASWKYSVSGLQGNQCNIGVILLQAKKGEFGLDKYNGDGMTCSYPFGTAAYPEKDLSRCTGKLKEDLQGIIINKLYQYLLQNLGQANESLRSLG